MKINTVPLPYFRSPIAKYVNFKNLEGFALLQSSDLNHGRFDIMTACPYDEFKITRDGALSQDVFHQLESFIPATTGTFTLPFQGGAIGYISYDVGAILSGLYKELPDFLINTPLIDMKLYDWAIVTDHLQQQTTLVYANNVPETSSIIQDICHRWHQNGSEALKPDTISPFKPYVDKAQYQKAFSNIYNDLMWGRAYQVNYTIPFSCRYQGDSWYLYEKLVHLNPVPFGGFLRFDDLDVLSFSPERFIQKNGNRLFTSPIKGTSKRSSDDIEDDYLKNELLMCQKNRAENVMIVDLMRNDLSKVSIAGSVQVDALLECQSFQSVHHLVSHISSELKRGLSMGDIFKACFPGGSITGAPKLESMRIIDEQERYARGVYCGSMGYVSYHGDMDFNIAIRTMMAKKNHLYLQAGGGITVSSVCDDELAECYTKIQAIIDNMNR